jgi:hypothetical protein
METRFLIVPPNLEIQLGIAQVVEYTREQAVDLIYRNTPKHIGWKEAQKLTDARINALLVEAHEAQKAKAAARYQLQVVA